MFYLIDKPQGVSSFQAIRQFAKSNQISKIGHTGTLDPLATGLLLVATDADTKLISYVDQGLKTYRATMLFGQVSDTFDITGEIKHLSPCQITRSLLVKTFASFSGTSMQKPPVFSAKKVDGKRAYQLARAKQEVTLKAVKVQMQDFKIITFSNKEVTFEVTVSRGTYIRSLIHDVGQKLGCGALMSQLRRIKIGPLNESHLNQEVDISKLLIYPIIELKTIKELKEGKQVAYKWQDGIFALKYQGQIIGIGEIKNNYLKSRKLLGNKI